MSKFRVILIGCFLVLILAACTEIVLPQPPNPVPAPSPTPTIVNTPTPVPSPTPTLPPIESSQPVTFTGKGRVNQVQFFSQLLNRNVVYQVYLPQEYTTSSKRYPVLYMLHGYSGKVEEWTWYGLFGRLDDLIATKQSPPYLIVLPEGDQEYWVDHPNGGPAWGAYVAQEVVGYVDAHYRTLARAESRAIGGLSMGGNGALQIALNYPGIFGVVGAHSPTMRTYDQKLVWWGDEKWFLAHDPITLAKTSPYLTQIKLWVDDGADDKLWLPRVQELRAVLLARKINFTWQNWPGDHVAAYWSDHMLDYLVWYKSALVFQP